MRSGPARGEPARSPSVCDDPLEDIGTRRRARRRASSVARFCVELAEASNLVLSCGDVPTTPPIEGVLRDAVRTPPGLNCLLTGISVRGDLDDLLLSESVFFLVTVSLDRSHSFTSRRPIFGEHLGGEMERSRGQAFHRKRTTQNTVALSPSRLSLCRASHRLAAQPVRTTAFSFLADDIGMTHSQKPGALSFHPDICIPATYGLSRSGVISGRNELLQPHHDNRVVVEPNRLNLPDE